MTSPACAGSCLTFSLKNRTTLAGNDSRTSDSAISASATFSPPFAMAIRFASAATSRG